MANINKPQPYQRLNIVHISDTHNLHDAISFAHLPLSGNPAENILIHTGDFSNDGTREEVARFNSWLGRVADLFASRVVIPGNHDWRAAVKHMASGKLNPAVAFGPDFFANSLPNATHVPRHTTVDVQGLVIHGCSWDPWHDSALPDFVSRNEARLATWHAYVSSKPSLRSNSTSHAGEKMPTVIPHSYGCIPPNVDVVLSHGPPVGILDCLHQGTNSWGSSVELVRAFHNLGDKAPKVHLFGHVHEQRGFYVRDSRTGRLEGRVEYRVRPGAEAPPTKAPFDTYPSTFQIIANTAMCNHCRMEGASAPYLAGGPRHIVATRCVGGGNEGEQSVWEFSYPNRVPFTQKGQEQQAVASL